LLPSTKVTQPGPDWPEAVLMAGDAAIPTAAIPIDKKAQRFMWHPPVELLSDDPSKPAAGRLAGTKCRAGGFEENMRDQTDLNRELDRLQQYLPNWAARMVRSLRHPACRVIRITLAILLVLGGLVGFLPILGFWMVPLGLALIAQDVPFLRRPMARFLGFVNRKLAPQGSA
jgi:hypothetical protein